MTLTGLRACLLSAGLALGLIASALGFVMAHPAFADIGGCDVLPANNIWKTRIDGLDPHPNSDNFVQHIGASAGLHPDFGTVYEGAPNGIPYLVVPTNQPLAPVTLTPYGNQADPGPYPIPANAVVEGGNASGGDRHLLIVRQGDCKLFELYRAFANGNGSWRAYGAIFDLNSNMLRPDEWTSADAAGLPILPGLVKYEEVQAALRGDAVIHHALRFTVPQTHYSYLWPARHRTDTSDDPNDPPMGLRFRLKDGFNLSGFSPSNQVILRTLKQYGMFVADNGSPFYLSGAPNAHWDDDDLHELQASVHGYDFEAVDESGLMVNANSGQAQQGGVTPRNAYPHTHGYAHSHGDPDAHPDFTEFEYNTHCNTDAYVHTDAHSYRSCADVHTDAHSYRSCADGNANADAPTVHPVAAILEPFGRLRSLSNQQHFQYPD